MSAVWSGISPAWKYAAFNKFIIAIKSSNTKETVSIMLQDSLANGLIFICRTIESKHPVTNNICRNNIEGMKVAITTKIRRLNVMIPSQHRPPTRLNGSDRSLLTSALDVFRSSSVIST